MKNVPEVTRHSAQADWHQPVLRRLPIAATAATPGKGLSGNEGSGGGKGDASTIS